MGANGFRNEGTCPFLTHTDRLRAPYTSVLHCPTPVAVRVLYVL